MTTLTALDNSNLEQPGPADLAENLTRTQELPGPLPGRRRRFTSEEKRQFIKQAMAPGESMSSVGRRHGLSVSLLFRWRRQLDGQIRAAARNPEVAARNESRELRERVRELERLLGRKTLEAELLQQELARLGHNPGAALSALDAAGANGTAAAPR
jgi:transposase